MEDKKTQSQTGQTGTPLHDDDDIQFDITGEEDTPMSNLHVNLNDEDTTSGLPSEDSSSHFSLENNESASENNSHGSFSSFSLQGVDNLMDLFKALQNRIEEETNEFNRRQKEHDANITQEQEAKRKEKEAYEKKRKQMLAGLEQSKMKLLELNKSQQ